jgi:hypothetical protein
VLQARNLGAAADDCDSGSSDSQACVGAIEHKVSKHDDEAKVGEWRAG